MGLTEDKALEGVPCGFLVRLAEAFLAESQAQQDNIFLHEREFGGVSMKMMVNSHWTGFERFMLIGRDWQCGFNLATPCLDDEPCYPAFMVNMAMSNAAVYGKKGFARDMTVLRMTFSDWKLEHQTV